MPYDFPKRLARVNAAVDGDDLTEDFAQIAERLDRVQGVHVASPTDEADRLPVEPMFKWGYTATAVPVGFGTFSGSTGHPGNPPALRVGVNASATIIPNSFDWEVIETLTMSAAGTATLVIDAMLQYIWVGFIQDVELPHSWANQMEILDISGTKTYRQNRAPSVRFAIRVDGEIVFATGPGGAYKRPPMGLRPTQSYQGTIGSDGDLAPGIVADRLQTINGPGRPADGIHLVAQKFVGAGAHTVELVGRRIPRPAGGDLPTDDVIAVYNRQLLYQGIMLKQTPSRSASPVTTADLTEGQPLSQASLKTNSLDNLTAAINTLDPSRIEPNTLRHFQVRSAVVPSTSNTLGAGQAQVVLSTAKTINNWAVDETDTSPSTDPSTAVTGQRWHIVSDVTLTAMQCAPPSGSFRTNSGNAAPDSYLKVFGRLQLKQILQAEADSNEYTHFAQVGLAYYSGTSYTIMTETIVTVSRNSSPFYTDDGEGVGGASNGWQDVPLFGVVDLTSTKTTNPIQFFVIVVGVASNSILTVDIEYRRAILNAVHIRE